MEGVRPAPSGPVCISRDVLLSTLVFPQASSFSQTGCNGTDMAEASSVCFSPIALLPGVLERFRRDWVLLLLIPPRSEPH